MKSNNGKREEGGRIRRENLEMAGVYGGEELEEECRGESCGLVCG